MTWFAILVNICLILHSISGTKELEKPKFLYSTSVRCLAKLVQLENKLMVSLDGYARDMEEKLNMIRLYQEILKRPTMQCRKSREEYVENPLNAFTLLRRLQQDWPKWLEYLREGKSLAKLEKMEQLLMKAPSEKDLHTAIAGLLRIESVYDLETSHMAKGLLLDKQYSSHLSSPECLVLGDYLYNRTEYSRSSHWYRTALRLYKPPYDRLFSRVLRIKRKSLERKYAQAIVYEPDVTQEKPPTDIPAEWKELSEMLIKQLVSHGNSANIRQLVDEYLEVKEQTFIDLRAQYKAKPTAMEKGCRGLWPKRQESRLTCRYFQENSAYSRMAPLKMELLNMQPLIVLYHDVLHDGEIEAIKNVNSQQTAAEDEANAVQMITLKDALNLHRRIAEMTGIDTAQQKSLNLLNFGLGGYVKSRCQGSKCKGHKLKGSCIASVILYASDVALGGATIFPKLKLVVEPKKGNALFWYNLNDAGETDPLTKHAVCPVVMGSRWAISQCIDEQQHVSQKLCLA